MNDKIKIIKGDARKFNNYSHYKTIIVSLEAGVNNDVKNSIFHTISKQIDKETIVIARSSTSDLFVNSSEYIQNYFDIIDSVDIFEGYSVSYILKKK